MPTLSYIFVNANRYKTILYLLNHKMNKPLRQLIVESTEPESETLPRASCVLLRKNDKFLSVSRKNDPDSIGMPGGKKDDNGETDLEAAARELREETGLECTELAFAFAGPCYGKEDFWVTTYLGEWEGEIDTPESGVVKWVTASELVNGHFADYNRKLFKELGIKILDLKEEVTD